MDPKTRDAITKVYIKHLPYDEYLNIDKMEPSIKAQLSRIALIRLIEYIKVIPLEQLIYLKQNHQNYL